MISDRFIQQIVTAGKEFEFRTPSDSDVIIGVDGHQGVTVSCLFQASCFFLIVNPRYMQVSTPVIAKKRSSEPNFPAGIRGTLPPESRSASTMSPNIDHSLL